MSSCPICEKNEFTRFLEPPLLLQCPSCGLVCSDKSSFLSDYPLELNYCQGSGRAGFIERFELYYLRRRWSIETNFLKKFITAGSSILDIGCGNGEFLKECERHGIYAEGIEKNIDSESKVKNILKIDIESAPLPQKKYDAITFYHSLEHIQNPASVLQKVIDNIKDGGIIIVQVPNLDSWQFRVFKRKWFHLFLPFHRYHFSTDTLCRLLERKGFSVIHVRYFSNRWNAEGWSASLLRWNPMYFIREKRKGKNPLIQELTYLFLTILFLPVAILEAMFMKGGVITIVARK